MVAPGGCGLDRCEGSDGEMDELVPHLGPSLLAHSLVRETPGVPTVAARLWRLAVGEVRPGPGAAWGLRI